MRLSLNLSLAILAAVPTAQATILYTNLGPGDTYSTLKYGIDGTGYMAHPFQVNQQAVLTSIRVVVGHEGRGSTAPVVLYSGTPTSFNTMMEVYTFTPATTTTGVIETLVSSTNPILNVGTTYWLSIGEAGDPDGDSLLWWMNNQGVHALYINSAGTGTDSWTAAMEVTGRLTDVPEPAAGAAALCGLLLLGAYKRRRHA